MSTPVLLGSADDSLREAFGLALVALADANPRMLVLDGDVAGGTGAHHFRKAYPTRFVQCGIAEQNMVGVAAGLAATGWIPVVTTFAVFALRALEQTRLSVAYAKRNVKIVASHPGLDAGPDGASTQALEDLAAFRAVPNMTVIVPADALEVEQATAAILQLDGPVYMRTGRSPAPRVLPADYQFELGKAKILRDGSDVTLIACGVEVARALAAAQLLAAEKISARVVNLSTIKPIDIDTLVRCARETGCVVTAEDHNVYGGMGSAVAEALAAHAPCPIEFVGVRDVFGESGEPPELALKYGLTAPAIAAAARCVINRKRRAT